MSYQLSIAGGQSLTSAQIVARLEQCPGFEAQRAIERIKHIEAHGCSYSNEHYDVLAHGWDVSRELIAW